MAPARSTSIAYFASSSDSDVTDRLAATRAPSISTAILPAAFDISSVMDGIVSDSPETVLAALLADADIALSAPGDTRLQRIDGRYRFG